MYRVLLAEDEAMIRSGLRKLVEDVIGGFKVSFEAVNGAEAVAYLKEDMPDLVITDIRMPEINGIEVVRWIKEHYPSMRMVILSGYSEFEHARQAMRYGVIDYLLKPVDRVEFAQCLKKIKADLDQDRNKAMELQERKDGLPRIPDREGVDQADNEDHYLIRRVKELIHEKLQDDASLQSIADHVNMNYQYLSSLFKTVTNQNYSEYVKEAKLNKAKQLLKTTNLKIYEIAELCGYASPKHFMTLFKQVVQMTPLDYRKRMNEQ